MLLHVPYARFYRALLFHESHETSVVVSVPADIGLTRALAADELAVEVWIKSEYFKDAHVLNVAQYSLHVEHVPCPDRPCLSRSFTIFFSPRGQNYVGTEINACLNAVADEMWYGNVLVIKHNVAGEIINIDEDDISIIEGLVIKYSSQFTLLSAFYKRLFSHPYSLSPMSLSTTPVRVGRTFRIDGNPPEPTPRRSRHQRFLDTFELSDRSPSPELELPDLSSARAVFHARQTILFGNTALVYASAECMARILSHCSFATIVAFSHVDDIAHEHACAAIRTRITKIVRHFLSAPEREKFFDMLGQSNGGLCGSVAMSVVTTGLVLGERERPRDLNVLVPLGEARDWHAYLISIGYDFEEKVAIHEAFHGKVLTMRHFYNEEALSITVSQTTTRSILPALLSSTVTSQMSIITTRHIFCFYPELTSRLVSVRGMHQPLPGTELDIMLRELKLCDSTKDLGFSCGEACPAIWRRTRDLKGVGVFDWEGYSTRLSEQSGNDVGVVHRGTDMLKAFADTRIKWRIGQKCINPLCTFNSLLSPREVL
ncbi:hypothetical protein Hypma_011905 [Hypsizygus marmoreus]|uniref:Uncharacterized protein n=1 Tax=Hypsizygus marmoreus TaxID=39966 RepID=A0A369JPR5_HYPMA|nr:hypothetical protein Hypma_011905 [Hypsizygus marmoreus]